MRDFLYTKINQMKQDVAGLENYTIKVYDEVEFASAGIKEKEISVVVKRMSSTLTFNTITRPYQILILSEENMSEYSMALFSKFATTYNWYVISKGNDKSKLQFSQPMMMSNFEIAQGSYRSVLFISATEYILENVADIENNTINIDTKNYKIISMSVGYGANMNTEQFPSYEIAKSIKSTASLTLSVTVPAQKNDFTNKCFAIMNGSTTVSGNTDFSFVFKIGDVQFNKTLKLVECNFTTMANDIPSLVLAFME